MSGRIRKRLSLMAVGLLGGFLTCEIGARALIWTDDRQVISQALLDPASAPKNGIARSMHVIRVASNPRIVFELKPNLQVNFMGGRMSTNSKGFRGPERSLEKSAGVVRIVALGDSIGMGWRLNDGDDLMALLEGTLNQKYPARKWEVINTSVLGYNTTQELETLKEKGLQYQPDVVLLNYVVNDIELPAFIRTRRNYFQIDHLYLSEFLRDRLGVKKRDSGLMVIDPRSYVPEEFSDPERVPPDYKDMVGWEVTRKRFEELRQLSQQHHFKVVVSLYPYYVQQAADLARENGFVVLDGASLLKKYMDQHQIPEWGPPLTVDPIDGKPDSHPSRLANELVLPSLVEKVASAAGPASK